MVKYDLAVIGSGPGGYVAAIRAAQKGMRVVCIEKDAALGGTCLNVGCIPSKALLHSTEYYYRVAHQGKEHGIEYTSLSVNLAKMMERKQRIVAGLVGGIGFLFKKNKIAHIQGEAKILHAAALQAGNEMIEARHILLATGSEPIPLPFLPFDEIKVLSSTGALGLAKIPKKMLLVGAGVIGLELGSVYRRLGADIEVIELLDRVAPGFDREISKAIQNILQKQGFSFRLGTRVVEGKVEAEQVVLTLEQGETVTGDVVLVAIGRRPYFKGLGLDEVGVRQDKQGRVMIDQHFRTSIPNIYAIGDLVDGPMLAHKASEEAIAAVDIMVGETTEVNYLGIPNVMYTWPEVACVGMTEEEARQAQLSLLIGKIPFKAISRARCSGDEEGLVKILGEKNTGRLIGLHMVGPSVSEMIHEGVIAIQQRMTLQAIAHASHAHPTCSEAIKEAALAAIGHAIHV
jgi:dihydrolipoamide dehydrogenase